MNKKKKFLKEILKYIPSAAQTLSKNPSQYAVGVSPLMIVKGKGSFIWDTENKKYLDTVLALGPMIFGYANKRIDSAVKKQIDKGTVFSLPSVHELTLAKLLRDIIPCAEMSRFVLNGNDATSGAVRLARYITKRDHIAKCGYHGCQDWSICTKEGRNTGVPEIIKSMTHDFSYNDIDSLEKIFKKYPNQIAAVIMEPTNHEKPINDFLDRVKQVTHKNGAILIFDEMITGFRWALGGAQEYFNVIPDLACFGKAISNGYPLSVICGKSEFMNKMDGVFVSTTFGGYTLGLVAAIETIKMMKEKKNIHEEIHKKGEYLINQANTIFQKHHVPLKFEGYGPHPILKFLVSDDYQSRILKTYIIEEFDKNKILFNPSMLIGYTHTKQDLDLVLDVFKKICSKIGGMQEFLYLKKELKGDVVQPRAVRAA